MGPAGDRAGHLATAPLPRSTLRRRDAVRNVRLLVGSERVLSPAETATDGRCKDDEEAERLRALAPDARVLTKSDTRPWPQRWVEGEVSLDLYHRLFAMRMSYTVCVLFVVYILLNLIFAGLYMIGNNTAECTGTDGSYGRVLIFSVQTFSTIGYGTFQPLCTYHQIVMVVEAFVALLSVSLMTGLLFGKLSKPEARMRFSSVACVPWARPGRPCPELHIRMINLRTTRGRLLGATAELAVITISRSPEGVLERKVRTLPLVTQTNPVFCLTWTIVHKLDEQSPLVANNRKGHEQVSDEELGLDAELRLVPFVALIVSLSATEDLYDATVTERHVYLPTDLRVACYFKNMISMRGTGFVADMDKLSSHISQLDASVEDESEALEATMVEDEAEI